MRWMFSAVCAALSMWCAAAAPAQQGASHAESRPRGGQQARRFHEEPGRREFRRVLAVRPIGRGDADTLGLTARQAERVATDAIRCLSSLEVREYAHGTDEFLVSVPDGDDEESLAETLLATGNFRYVEPDWTVYPVACPDDINFSGQWYHLPGQLDSCAAWSIETGSPSVVIALCDTGVRATHGDLRLHRREGLHVPSMTWEGAGGAIADVSGHGTRVTGCAAGNGDNGIGIAGMGWNLGHRMMRVTDSTSGSAALSNLLAGARAAADAGDRVVSVSFTGVTSASVQSTGDYVRARGALLVWAAGNEAATLAGQRNDSVIVVGATDSAGQLASFSNRGPLVDLVAPGVGIYTTSHTSDSSYASATGTSFACPLAAGLCGLVWSRDPSLTPAQVESILRASCTDLGAPGTDDLFGFGRIDAAAALSLASGGAGGGGGGTGGGSGGGDGGNGDTTPPAVPTSLAVTAAGSASITLAWAPNADSDLAGYSVRRSLSPTDGFGDITSAPIASTTFTDRAVAAGTRYYYAVRAVDHAGNQSRSSIIVSAVPQSANGPVVLLEDGFESGGLVAGGWLVQGPQAAASTLSRYTGAWGARLQGTTWMARSRPTSGGAAGFASITLNFACRTVSFDSGEALLVEWWDGSVWRLAATIQSPTWSMRSVPFPAAAANNPAFGVRLRTNANSPLFERADIDGVQLLGTPG